jgi:predicted MFS family arabinose efflux permease
MNETAKPWALYDDRRRTLFLVILFLVAALNNLDKTVITVVLEPIKREFGVSDTALGVLSGLSFALLYATLGIPVALAADRGNRKTIIGISLVIWSAMTMLCGLAQSFVQLVVARVGVGAGEAGGIPPAQSLIADYFPPERRARAITIFSGSMVVGYLLGLTVGAQVAAHFGWRATMIAAGAPGLLLALVAFRMLDEPRRHLAPPAARRERGAGMADLLRIARTPSLAMIIVGITLYNAFSAGVFSFIPPYLMRVLKVPLPQIGLYYGALSASAALIGITLGGWLVGRLSVRDVRWQAWLCAGGLLVSLPFFELGFLMPSFPAFLAAVGIGMVALNVAYGVMYTSLHSVCGSSRRALAVAVSLFCSNLIGAGLGPVVTGLLSDAFTAAYGPLGLRYAMMTAALWLVASGLLMLFAGRAMVRDLAD